MLGFVWVLREYERGIVFRLGRLVEPRGPGIVFLIPVVDRLVKVDLRTVTLTGASAGGDHEGQRAGEGERGRLLPDRRPERGDHAGRELHGRHLADRADDVAGG